MNKEFGNKNRMYQAVAEVIETNKLIWEEIPIFVLVFSEYKSLLAKIIMLAKAAGIDLTGVTGAKNSTAETLADMLFEFCSNLALFALRTNNAALLSRTDLTDTDIKRIRQGNFLLFAQEVARWLSQYKVQMVDYAITDADILKLNTLIAQYAKEMPEPDAKYSDKQAAQAELKNTFHETDVFLAKQLDKAVDGFRSKDATFNATYYFSRNIKNIGIRHEEKTGTTPAK